MANARPLFDDPPWKDWAFILGWLGALAGGIVVTRDSAGDAFLAVAIDLGAAASIQFALFGLLPALLRRAIRKRGKADEPHVGTTATRPGLRRGGIVAAGILVVIALGLLGAAFLDPDQTSPPAAAGIEAEIQFARAINEAHIDVDISQAAGWIRGLCEALRADDETLSSLMDGFEPSWPKSWMTPEQKTREGERQRYMIIVGVKAFCPDRDV